MRSPGPPRKVRLAVEVKPRLLQPRVAVDVKRRSETSVSYRTICKNRDATLVAVD